LGKTNNIEIMSPVGSFGSLMAAIQGGADSVYFGIGHLNMRSKSSQNFTLNDLRNITNICREHNIKTYLTLNTVIYDNELAEMRVLVEKAKEQEEMLASMADNSMPGTNQATSRSLPGNRLGGGKWYFYNPATKSTGYSEFVKKWGKRKLEDNWWLINKKSLYVPQEEVLAENDSTATTSDSTAVVSNDPHNREYYLKDLPFTEEQIALSSNTSNSYS